MGESFMERVHLTLCGVLVETCRVPGVENIFASGGINLKLYSDAMDAYDRICVRLGVDEEDDDLEIIINSVLDLEQEMSCRMYRYGVQFGTREEWKEK